MRTPLRTPVLTLSSLLGMAGLWAAGCAERGSLNLAGDDTDRAPAADTADSAAPAGSCTETVDLRVPLDGATGQSPGVPIRVTFNQPPNRALVRVRVRVEARDIPGELVWADDGLSVAFEPLQPVRSGARHELRVAWACGEEITTFTPGQPVWSIVTSAATQTAPTGVDLLPAFGTQLLSLDGASRDAASFTLAPASGGRQNACGVTATGQGARRDDDVASWTFTSGTFALSDRLAPAAQITIAGRLNAQAGTLADPSVQARLQVADVAGALDVSPDDLCDDLSGNACAPCPVNQGLTGRCVLVTLDDVDVRPSNATVEALGQGEIGPGCR